MEEPPSRDAAATKPPLAPDRASGQQDDRLARLVTRERARLLNFIRRRVADPRDAEDVLQDVFYALVEANRLLMPIEHVSGWLYRVARNRIIDFLRRKKPAELPPLDELLPSSSHGPEATYERTVLLEALERALTELPKEQRDVFLAHEVEGRSFKELSAATGVGVNTLLSRKHYAVQHLRKRLRRIHDELTNPGS